MNTHPSEHHSEYHNHSEHHLKLEHFQVSMLFKENSFKNIDFHRKKDVSEFYTFLKKLI